MNSKNSTVVYVGSGIIIGILLSASISPIIGYGKMMSWGRGNIGTEKISNSRPTSINQNTSIDRHFIEQMIPHHDGAIAMANVALQKARHSEIKTLAQSIIQSQTKEIKDMRAWYSDWYNVVVPERSVTTMGGMMSGGGMHMGGAEDMLVLENATDFDKAFIEQMIPHHQLAIMMARMLESGTNKPEMLLLAQNIIEAQTREIIQMQGWYNEWYR